MTEITPELLRSFMRIAGERLRGEWVLIGGTVLPLLEHNYRATADIDLVGPKEAGNDQLQLLLEIAAELGLPVEAINQAGAFFLRRIEGWHTMIVPLHKGPSATIFRPTVTLFILLKLGRLSESDLEDCMAFLSWAKAAGEKVEGPRVLATIAAELGKKPPAERQQRLARLHALLKEG